MFQLLNVASQFIADDSFHQGIHHTFINSKILHISTEFSIFRSLQCLLLYCMLCLPRNHYSDVDKKLTNGTWVTENEAKQLLSINDKELLMIEKNINNFK